jgi:alkanesulfonate monooxygenase SsuD/methylene tetrahydromethanopterin reductase-like flavin-dependent oxidoreductase (luciferase family)
MAGKETMSADRMKTNPAFSDRKLKLGTFQTNLDSGCVMSDLEGRLEITWPNTVELAKVADEMEFEAIVPVARWRGFGGAVNPQGPGFETYTWAAGIAASTAKAGVISTSHVSINHPIVAAKQSTVIDHISGGRYMLNIVTGWNKPEIDMFGSELRPHDERYDMAEEWLTVVKRLWTEDDEFDHEGKYYRIKKGYLQPKPIQKPYPALMNAGGSDRGVHFVCKNCDMAFLGPRSYEFDAFKAHVDTYRNTARKEYGREIGVWSLAYVVQAETEKEAQTFHEMYVNKKGDWAAATNALDTMGVNAKTFPPGVLDALKGHFIAGWGGYPLVGTKEQIVDGLQTLSRIGLDGVLLSWPLYIPGMREFRDVTYPLVKQAGLRDLR